MKLEAKKLLFDVMEACRDVERFTAGKAFRDYLEDGMLRRRKNKYGQDTKSSCPMISMKGSNNWQNRRNGRWRKRFAGERNCFSSSIPRRNLSGSRGLRQNLAAWVGKD